eukprot:NODE_944_length_1750_cov_154.428219_g768_i1.p2 GENE.NODE_944_length_1750_cov_154.428219_g768_i1~~NODE_944_length_1750_cov_154.428219_g768_i1.p2  ORF type:complete len:243 (-),score=88.79 NODE_944_length_1750_cov_154.428219_g768_i1:73-801(-)
MHRNLYYIENYTKRILARAEKGNQKTVGPADIVRLYDILLQNIVDVLAIPGVEEDAELGVAYAHKQLCYRASKMYWKGEAFRGGRQFPEAAACYTHGEQLVSDCFLFQRSNGIKSEAIVKLSESIRTAKCGLSAEAYLHNHNQGSGLAQATAKLSLEDEARCLFTSMDEFQECKTMIPVPLPFEPFPCKPIFYDIASNFLKENELVGKKAAKSKPTPQQQEEEEGQPAEPKKGGWFNFRAFF